MRALVLFERSGRVRDAIRAKGHMAVSVDLEPSDAPGPHMVEDVDHLLVKHAAYVRSFDVVIAHPPCTYLTAAGVRWLYEYDREARRTVVDSNGDPVRDADRWARMQADAILFRRVLHVDVPRVAVENPRMHVHAATIVGRRQDQTVQPWQFGHPEKKGTGFWLRGLPPLVPTHDVRHIMATLPVQETDRVHRMAPGPERQRLRSLTYPGIAAAIADQWVTP